MAEPLAPAEVAAWRTRFPVLAHRTYLVNNSLGAMPDTTPGSLREFTDAWASQGVEAWETTWFPELRAVADLLADLIGAPHGTVVLHQNVAALVAIAVSGIDWRASRESAVISSLDWPGHHHLLTAHRDSVVHVVEEPDGAVTIDVDRLCGAIDRRTALVVVSHVLFRSAAIVDLAPVVQRAHEVGALVLVDGYHAVGHMPVDVLALGCDLYVGGSVKWLCGGPGVAYLYVHPGLQERFRPWAVGWLGHADPFGFELRWEPGSGAMGWLGGTPSIPSLYSARAGYRVIAEVGTDRIRATSVGLTSHLVAGLRGRGIRVNSPTTPDRRAGHVAFDLGAGTQAAAERLVRDGIVVDHRPGAGIRVGPHFFTTTEEIDRLLAALDG